MSQLAAQRDTWIVPRTASDIVGVLRNIESEESEERIAFAIAGALFISGWKAGVYRGRRAGGIDKYVLYFKFVEALDPRRRLSKTLVNLSGRFLNYLSSWDAAINNAGRPKVSVMEPARWVIEAVERASRLDDDSQERVTRALLKVRDASYLYTTYSYEWTNRLADIDTILKPQEQLDAANADALTSGEEVGESGE